MTRALTLADFAQVEAEGRARFYPDMVRRGELSEDAANHDWRCWIAIANFFAGPADYHCAELARCCLTWDDLDAAAQAALAKRETALIGCKPENQGPLEARRDAVQAMAWRLERRAKFFRDLNAALQAQASARRKSKEREAA